MRPLTPADPAAIGGHRLLGRLGSGGMGTVYLGRSPAGNLVAVKVIRADHAADPAFRARFRREATAAGRLTGRWVVPVVAADPEAREPWLATPFVPGPSLAEAVAAYGPLPAGTVRTLGVRLAEALEQVHRAGLVHRDVKPANILLALDGPRLIDFGIARETGSTALTSADAVVGTPGYLAPELASAGAPAPEPASDLFSLGCVLAYAATGRAPFGGGHPAAVVFRTIHEEPELGDVQEELRPAIASCLAKDPAARPTPADLRTLLGALDAPDSRDASDGWNTPDGRDTSDPAEPADAAPRDAVPEDAAPEDAVPQQAVTHAHDGEDTPQPQPGTPAGTRPERVPRPEPAPLEARPSQQESGARSVPASGAAPEWSAARESEPEREPAPKTEPEPASGPAPDAVLPPAQPPDSEPERGAAPPAGPTAPTATPGPAPARSESPSVPAPPEAPPAAPATPPAADAPTAVRPAPVRSEPRAPDTAVPAGPQRPPAAPASRAPLSGPPAVPPGADAPTAASPEGPASFRERLATPVPQSTAYTPTETNTPAVPATARPGTSGPAETAAVSGVGPSGVPPTGPSTAAGAVADAAPPAVVGEPRAVTAPGPGAGAGEVAVGALPAVPRGTAGPAEDWLPPGLRRLITERSTRALDLPAPEVTRADGGRDGGADTEAEAEAGEVPRKGLSRRRLFAFGGAALAAAAVPAVLLRGGGEEPGAATGTPTARNLPTLTLGLQADLTGPGKATGQAHERGARLAVERHNARPDALFRLALKVADDAGDAARAERVARELAADPAVTAVLGPTWDAALTTVAGICAAADLALLPVSVDSPENAASTWQTLCLTRPADVQISFPVIHYLSQVRPSPRTAVVEDEAGGATAWRISQFLQQAPPARGTVTVHRVPAAGSGSDIGAAAAALTAAGADAAVLTAISPERAARFARALADAGFRGPRVGLQHVMEPGFLSTAGRAAEGWVFGALFTDPLAVPAAAEFTAAHRKAYGAPPARWATEAYDAVGLAATALAALTEGARDRAGLSRRIFRTAYEGLAKPIEHNPDSRALIDGRLGHLYKAESGAYRYLGLYADVRSDT
ncbi:ABC transporter substrate-binding protein [Streptomyces sp. NPDC048603]|uniref:bifunctional serine/threonine-protein kinase/ABC transporter substrate-binding protein n=1 Tax=Streptomyces sp. NPDC048603 TaxID=3365577 RepID=UPI003716D42C